MQSRHRSKPPRCRSRLPPGREGQSPTLHAEIRSYFDIARSDQLERAQTVEKSHGRLEIRNFTVSHEVDWTTPERSYPGQFRFPKLATIAMVESRTERGDKISTERRSYISSRALSAAAFADAVRSHWAIENKLHWVLDTTSKEDQSRLRVGHGAKNMAVVRHLTCLIRSAMPARNPRPDVSLTSTCCPTATTP